MQGSVGGGRKRPLACRIPGIRAMKSGERFRVGFILNPMIRFGGCSGTARVTVVSPAEAVSREPEILSRSPASRSSRNFNRPMGARGNYPELFLDTDQSGKDRCSGCLIHGFRSDPCPKALAFPACAIRAQVSTAANRLEGSAIPRLPQEFQQPSGRERGNYSEVP